MDDFKISQRSPFEAERFHFEVPSPTRPEPQQANSALKGLMFQSLNRLFESHAIDPQGLEFAQAMRLLDFESNLPNTVSASNPDLSSETQALIAEANQLAQELILTPSPESPAVVELIRAFLEILRETSAEHQKILLETLLKSLFLQKLMADFNDKKQAQEMWHSEKLAALHADFKAEILPFQPKENPSSPAPIKNSEYNESKSFTHWLEQFRLGSQPYVNRAEIQKLSAKYQDILGLLGA